jgi:hypothetical protein
MFPKKGKSFPCVRSLVAAELQKELGNTHQAVKTVMRWTGANERTVKNWLAGRYGPSGDHLIHLFRYSDMVLDAVLRQAGREQAITVKGLVSLRKALAAALMQIDALMSERDRTT